ncbi:acetate/propionate family kinase [Bauldia sp.]|uniref:acetate/propionate family kinase n=1 Tax=Bauldia sp. TaxID=2575872 RepID=UPI003BABD61F
MTTDRTGILVLNSGSTSIKFAAYRGMAEETLAVVCRGGIDAMEDMPHFAVEDANGRAMASHDWAANERPDQAAGLAFIVDWLSTNLADLQLTATGHRVVLGGEKYGAPVVITDDVLADLDALSAFEPSHQPAEIAGIRALRKLHPEMVQVACFDTSFHRTMPPIAQIYALPRKYNAGNLRHWGFHGISYDYISRQVPKHAPDARRLIVAHLGGGCSMCAIRDGHSVDTTMGFSAIEGLPMSTRVGAIDAGILLYLLRSGTLDVGGLETTLCRQSGLLGLSGISGDMRDLEKSAAPEAAEAIDYFVNSIVKYTGAYAAVLGGLDAFIFTAGIGENSALVRAKVCERLGWLGVTLDSDANGRNGPRISGDDSAVSVWVIPTDEEIMIAMHTLRLAGAAAGPDDQAKETGR